MKVILQDDDVKKAIRNYVRGSIPTNADSTFDVDIRAGRGGNGVTATVEVSLIEPVVQDAVTPTDTVQETAVITTPAQADIEDVIAADVKTVEDTPSDVVDTPAVEAEQPSTVEVTETFPEDVAPEVVTETPPVAETVDTPQTLDTPPAEQPEPQVPTSVDEVQSEPEVTLADEDDIFS